MLRIAITGNAGSGKSTLADALSMHGVDIICADIINRSLLENSGFIWKWLEAALQIDFKSNDLRINKNILRNILIKHPKSRGIIESLLHPIIKSNLSLQLSVIPEKPYCIIEVPLLFEAGMERMADRVILVSSDAMSLTSRITKRPDIDNETAMHILGLQSNSSDVFGQADDVILNDSDIENLNNISATLNRSILYSLNNSV